ncbi:TolC family protein [Achromobacter spanius]|uniref:TolC family protein n=1 Tax=Achromobacter spanius TaxID=217203 RepID=UPI001F0C5482|nr:TolC family protein [Achromobacter spanius]
MSTIVSLCIGGMRRPKIEKKASLHALAASMAAVLLAGCSVQPKQFEAAENRDRAIDLIARSTANQEPILGAVDLYEAMARAIKYNLDVRVEMMGVALAQRELDLKHYDMLPKFVASLDYSGRDNYSGGASQSLLTGRTSLEPSTSSEKNVLQSNLQLSWDVLDFGLSYVRAKQAADRVNMAEERKRKVMNRLIEDVRTAYWRAVSAERLLGKIRELETATQTALDLAAEQDRLGLTAPLAPLSYQREMLGIRRDVQALGRELGVAKQQLAALMNLPPNTQYTIAIPPPMESKRSLVLPGIADDSAAWLQVAIENRPELREVAYQLRVNGQEDTAALLRSLPSLKLFGGVNASTNDLLYNSNWIGWGAVASWNLLNIFRLPAEKAQIKAEGDLLDQRQLALTTAVATQVEVSRARYALRQDELDTARRFYDVQARIEDQIDSGFKAEKLSRQSLIREQMNTLVARVRYDLALADLQNAYANVFASLGIDPVDTNMSTSDAVPTLAGKLRDMWTARDNFAINEQDARVAVVAPTR